MPREPGTAFSEPAAWLNIQYSIPSHPSRGRALLTTAAHHVTGVVHPRTVRQFSSCRYQIQCARAGQDNQDISHWNPAICTVSRRSCVRFHYYLLREHRPLTLLEQEDRTCCVLSQCLFQHPSDDTYGSRFATETHERARSLCTPIFWRSRRVCGGYVD